MHEWPLLIFTILFTAAVGLTGFVALAGVLLGGELDAAGRYRVLRDPMLAACGLAIAGLAASFAHLGYPLNAPNALRNVLSSAMSQEIVLASAFIGAICLAVLLMLRSASVSLSIVAGCFVVGLAAVWFMGEAYRNSSVLTWTHPNTHVMFFGGTVLMGVVLGLAMIGPRVVGLTGLYKLFAWAAAVVLAGLAAQLAVLPSYVTAIHANPMNAVVTFPVQPLELFQAYAGMSAVRWAVSLAGAAVLLYAVWRAVRSKEQVGFALIVAAGILLIGGEVVGRYVFYATHG
jgi:anaerobic dimethyl sulfoxide reductase subunit C (anchor subunit)